MTYLYFKLNQITIIQVEYQNLDAYLMYHIVMKTQITYLIALRPS